MMTSIGLAVALGLSLSMLSCGSDTFQHPRLPQRGRDQPRQDAPPVQSLDVTSSLLEPHRWNLC